MLVSRVNLVLALSVAVNSLLVYFVAIEAPNVERPALGHSPDRPFERRFLLSCQYALAAHRDQLGDRLSLAGDDEFLAGFDFADAAGKGLIGVAQGYGLAHAAYVARICATFNRWPPTVSSP